MHELFKSPEEEAKAVLGAKKELVQYHLAQGDSGQFWILWDSSGQCPTLSWEDSSIAGQSKYLFAVQKWRHLDKDKDWRRGRWWSNARERKFVWWGDDLMRGRASGFTRRELVSLEVVLFDCQSNSLIVSTCALEIYSTFDFQDDLCCKGRVPKTVFQ